MVFRHNLAQKWYKKYDERIQKKRKKKKHGMSLLKEWSKNIQIENKQKSFSLELKYLNENSYFITQFLVPGSGGGVSSAKENISKGKKYNNK